jgi:Mg2+ and Co2+ transporter CorA
MNMFEILNKNYYPIMISILVFVIIIERIIHNRILKKEMDISNDTINRLNSCNSLLKATNRLLKDRLDLTKKLIDEYNKKAVIPEEDDRDLYTKYQTSINLAIHTLLGTRTKAGQEALEILREIAGKTQ